MSETTANVQRAPYPAPLADMVHHLHVYDHWRVALDALDRGQGSSGLTLCIWIAPPDAYHPERVRRVVHYFPVPPAAYDERSWRRWLFDRLDDVQRHELMEHFRFEFEGRFTQRNGDETDRYVERPYAPSHGPGNDPYMVREVGTTADQRTSFRGDLNE